MDTEKRVRKAVGILVSELNARYEGTRKIAMAQLILLGEQAVPYLSAYVNEQVNFFSDQSKLDELDHKQSELYDGLNSDEYYSKGKEYQKWKEAEAKADEFRAIFEKKYPEEPSVSILESLQQIFEAIDDENRASLSRRLLTELKKRHSL